MNEQRVGRWKLGHQPALQGLRGIAVLAVFAFHLGVVPGGWLGVELFFVLSGFLITLLVLNDIDGRRFHFRDFYLRRFARLMPAAVIAITLTCVAAATLAINTERTLRAGFASLFYFANWAEVANWPMGAFGHMWSLSIEEQFYVVWPLAALLLMRAARRSWQTQVIVVVAVVIVIATWRIWMVTTQPDWYGHLYYGSGSRGIALLLGCAAGLAIHGTDGQLRRLSPEWLVLTALTVVLAFMGMTSIQAPATWLGMILLFDLVTILVLLGSLNPLSVTRKILSIRPLVYIGDISYSLYLWHSPVIYIAMRALEGPVRYAVQLAGPFVLAALSYHALEQPVRGWVARWVRKRREPLNSAESTAVGSGDGVV